MNNDKKKEFGCIRKRRRGSEWVPSTVQPGPQPPECLPGFLRAGVYQDGSLRASGTTLMKGFSLLVRATKQAVFGVPDELNIRVRGLKETRGP